MPADTKTLIWIDLEMTGLDCSRDEILEISTVVTDIQLQIIAEGPTLFIHHPEEVLEGMDDWNHKQHSQSGLSEKVTNSSTTYAEAETKTLAFLKRYVKPGNSPMCGSGICQDRRFLGRLMPDLENFFHYRNLDVSTLKELVFYWHPQHKLRKVSKHRALDDVYDSINELKHYRATILKV